VSLTSHVAVTSGSVSVVILGTDRPVVIEAWR
jgi:hypothetical protein